jgi:hypothetical protein
MAMKNTTMAIVDESRDRDQSSQGICGGVALPSAAGHKNTAEMILGRAAITSANGRTAVTFM